MTLAKELKKNKRKSFLKKILILFILIGSLYGGYIYFFTKKEIIQPIEKNTFVVKKDDLKTFIEGNGKVTLKDEFVLNFETQGIIQKIYKKEGDLVKKGELIAQLDTTYLDIDIEKAQLALKTAKSNYDIKKNEGIEKENDIQNDIDIQEKQVDANIVSLENTKVQTEIDLQKALENQKNINNDLENNKKQSQINLINAQNSIDTAKIDIETAQNNLSGVIKEEEEKYIHLQEEVSLEIGKIFPIFEQNLFDIDSLLGISEENKYKNESFRTYLGGKNSNSKSLAENTYRTTKNTFDSFYISWQENKENLDEQNIISYSSKIIEIGNEINMLIDNTLDVLKNSVTSNTLSQTMIDNYISDFEKKLLDNKNTLSSFFRDIQMLNEQKTQSDNKIQTLKNQFASLEQKLKIAQANYEKVVLENEISLSVLIQKQEQAQKDIENIRLKNESLLSKEESQINISKTVLNTKKQFETIDMTPFLIAISTAEKNLEEVIKKKETSKLFAPMEGKIVDISGKVGEQTQHLKDSFATIINPQTMYIESFIEESEIIKIKKDQEVLLTFDSIEELTLTGKVFYINDKATIDTNSIVTYEVRITFDVSDKRVKDSMTTTIEFITKQVKNVFIIPVQAVKTINNKPSVILENGTVKNIVTGFTDGKNVEVITGLTAGEKIIY